MYITCQEISDYSSYTRLNKTWHKISDCKFYTRLNKNANIIQVYTRLSKINKTYYFMYEGLIHINDFNVLGRDIVNYNLNKTQVLIQYSRHNIMDVLS